MSQNSYEQNKLTFIRQQNIKSAAMDVKNTDPQYLSNA